MLPLVAVSVVGTLAVGAVLATRGWTPPSRGDWSRLVAIGLLWFGLYNVALNAGERPTIALGVGLLVAFAGVVLIATSSSGDGHRDLIGVGLCLLSAAAYAVSLVPPLLAYVGGALCLLGVAITRRRGTARTPPPRAGSVEAAA
jgi:drug/metabolite transporter (DMT)-like permease